MVVRQVWHSALPSSVPAQPQSASPAYSIADGACNGPSALQAFRPGWSRTISLCTSCQENIDAVSVHVYLRPGGPQEDIQPHSQPATWSIPEFIPRVVIGKKPCRASEKELLNCYQHTPEAGQASHQPGTSWDTCTQIAANVLGISVTSEENNLSLCIIVQHQRMKYRWCQVNGLHDCQLFHFLYE